jgi:hypothetical protein
LLFYRLSDNPLSRGSPLADFESTKRKIWLSLFLIIIADYACISYRRGAKGTVANEVCFVAGDGRAGRESRKGPARVMGKTTKWEIPTKTAVANIGEQ